MVLPKHSFHRFIYKILLLFIFSSCTSDTIALGDTVTLDCIQTDPSGIVPEDLYQVGSVTLTGSYPPFKKKLDVCGITLIAGNEISNSFMDLSGLFKSDKIHAAFSLKTFKHKGDERRLLSSLVNLDPNCIVNPHQVHSSNVQIVGSPGKISKTDAIVSSCKSLVLSIQVADCIPLYLADPKNDIIGIVHAGWKGIERGIVNNSICL